MRARGRKEGLQESPAFVTTRRSDSERRIRLSDWSIPTLWKARFEAVKFVDFNMASASCSFESCLSIVLSHLEHRGFFFQLKDKQKRALRSLFEGTDVVGILPTGFGKSLIFQLLVTEKFKRQGVEKRDGTILVICPLRSLMEDQLREVADLGISASSLPEASFEDINNGKFQVIYSSPECALEQGFINTCLKNKNGHFHNNMAAVVVDECHTIETWTGKRYSQ